MPIELGVFLENACQNLDREDAGDETFTWNARIEAERARRSSGANPVKWPGKKSEKKPLKHEQ